MVFDYHCIEEQLGTITIEFSLFHGADNVLILQGSYTLQMRMEDATKHQLTCISFGFSIGFIASEADKHVMRMKGMKGRFLRKLKSISTLKQSLVFQVNPSNQNFQTSFYREQEHKINNNNNNNNNPPQLFPGNIREPQVFNNVKDDQEMDSGFCGSGKENFGSPINSKAAVPAKDNAETAITLLSGSDNACTVPLSAVQVFKQSQTSAESLFDAKPLAFSEEMVMEHTHTDEVNLDSEEFPTLLDFEEKCPPGGSESVVLYTTSLRGIRKTFEDCNSIRFLLESFRVLFYERDVSMHLEFREELWRMLGGRVVPPRLFIGGRLIGGADEVVGLHEQGKLKKLLQGMPLNPSNGPCSGCAGVHFVLCSNCNGSCKVMQDGQAIEVSIRCLECNENGLIKCPICC
ncbi:hypothetical protein F0562_017070 [Nyssa sinensis]|uniref:Glutaredoxin domain-containing protein n=1 Tax=Nyssa sinensis TaxID=561372 RepID=A0A5J4ZE89_9ASTE|nr:hypothetical protein F0562_017070 [Nyssa sinensis]